MQSKRIVTQSIGKHLANPEVICADEKIIWGNSKDHLGCVSLFMREAEKMLLDGSVSLQVIPLVVPLLVNDLFEGHVSILSILTLDGVLRCSGQSL